LSLPESGTAFPLIQSVLKSDDVGVSADRGTTENGATLTVLDAGANLFHLSIPGLQIELDITANSDAGVPVGMNQIARMSAASLDRVLFGAWSVQGPTTGSLSVFVTGYQTAVSEMPTTGTATYLGSNGVGGVVLTPSGTAEVIGHANLQANFATGVVAGELYGLKAVDSLGAESAWNTVALTATIATGTATFSGTTAVTDSPSTPFALGGNAAGHVNGAFFDWNAAELGAVWSLSDGSGAALGIIGAERQPD
jgi:hypothetical protein